MNSAELIMGYMGGVILGCMFIFLGVALHMAYTKMDLMLECLKNCPTIMVRVPLKYGGPWGRVLLLGAISGFVTFPKTGLKRGGLCPEDLKKMPVVLKRKLVVMYWISIVLMGCMLLVFIIDESGLLE